MITTLQILAAFFAGTLVGVVLLSCFLAAPRDDRP